MKTIKLLSSVQILTVLVISIGLFSAVDAAENNGAKETVLAFNSLITARDADAAFAYLADGGVQFTLRSLHEGVNPESLTIDLVTHWTTILPVVLGSTSLYVRQVEILDTEVNGDVATVWTKTSTESVSKGSEQKKMNSFTEVYLLISTPDGWKIAAIADNRQSTKL